MSSGDVWMTCSDSAEGGKVAAGSDKLVVSIVHHTIIKLSVSTLDGLNGGLHITREPSRIPADTSILSLHESYSNVGLQVINGIAHRPHCFIDVLHPKVL